MGYINSDWINPFIIGQKIESVKHEGDETYIIFESGESLRLYMRSSKGSLKEDLIVTPYDKSGKVKQTIDIMDNENIVV